MSPSVRVYVFMGRVGVIWFFYLLFGIFFFMLFLFIKIMNNLPRKRNFYN